MDRFSWVMDWWWALGIGLMSLTLCGATGDRDVTGVDPCRQPWLERDIGDGISSFVPWQAPPSDSPVIDMIDLMSEGTLPFDASRVVSAAFMHSTPFPCIMDEASRAREGQYLFCGRILTDSRLTRLLQELMAISTWFHVEKVPANKKPTHHHLFTSYWIVFHHETFVPTQTPHEAVNDGIFMPFAPCIRPSEWTNAVIVETRKSPRARWCWCHRSFRIFFSLKELAIWLSFTATFHSCVCILIFSHFELQVQLSGCFSLFSRQRHGHVDNFHARHINSPITFSLVAATKPSYDRHSTI